MTTTSDTARPLDRITRITPIIRFERVKWISRFRGADSPLMCSGAVVAAGLLGPATARLGRPSRGWCLRLRLGRSGRSGVKFGRDRWSGLAGAARH